MFARGLVSGHPTKDVHPEPVEGFFSYSTPPLFSRKHSPNKSRVSVTSKLIEIKTLQVLHFGHLRKTGGKGSYRLVHTPPLLGPKPSSAKSNYSGHPTKHVRPESAEGLFSYSSLALASSLTPFLPHHFKTRARNSFPLISLHKTGGTPPAWSYQVSSVSAKGCRLMADGFLLSSFFPLDTKIPLVSPFPPLHPQKQGGVPPQKCRRADIFDFSPYISHFFASHSPARRSFSGGGPGEPCPYKHIREESGGFGRLG